MTSEMQTVYKRTGNLKLVSTDIETEDIVDKQREKAQREKR